MGVSRESAADPVAPEIRVSTALHPALLLLAAYVCGSFPSAYLAGRLIKGVDLRTIGSGNLGTTNVYRELGLWPALVVLAADATKGAVPVLWFPAALDPAMTPNTVMWWTLAVGACAIAGHTRPVFLLWRGGGKGVATAAGVFASITPVATLAAVVVFVVVVAMTRYVSLGSVAAAAALPIAEWATGAPMPARIAGLAIALFVVFAHRSNMGRVRAGTERRLGRREGAHQ